MNRQKTTKQSGIRPSGLLHRFALRNDGKGSGSLPLAVAVISISLFEKYFSSQGREGINLFLKKIAPCRKKYNLYSVKSINHSVLKPAETGANPKKAGDAYGNIPPAFAGRTRVLLGDGYGRLEEALGGEPVVSLRMNRGKSACEPSADRVPWCETGYYLPRRIPFTFDPLFHAGAYYVQEASSMFLEQAVRAFVKSPVRCLDLCAAPGGKSTHLCALLPEGSLVVSNEVIRSRSGVLVENLVKWGNPGVAVTRSDAEEVGRLTHFFGLVVADVPCSGEGLFRKDPASASGWSLRNVALCAARQRRILSDVWPALMPGGILIYSTCTYNTEENEDNLAFLVETLGASPLDIPCEAAWQVAGALKNSYPACRFFPHRARGEGFFLAAVRKDGCGAGEGLAGRPGGERRAGGKIPSRAQKALPGFPGGAGSLLLHPERFLTERRGDVVEALPACQADALRYLAGRLRMVSSGLRMGEIRGDGFIPSHALAMSCELNRDAFASLPLSRGEAVRYLRKESLALAGEKGYALVLYDGLPLGFVKRLGSRANNLYPPEWRIRSME
jgi:16S rRNA C967 or C1407 C5-methylase (RsmB/RsmF family)/NOL1/NOP2/fmu family ribosome biogenesis protein